uniref:Variable surface protein n=1 Tax=viral metagenome TaxID=1070528 RepID=A0A6C0EGL1_9ZZZZ
MSAKLKIICSEIIEKCVEEFKDDHNFNKIKKEMLDPCVNYILNKIYPYVLASCVIFVLIFLMIVTILVILIFNKKNSNINTGIEGVSNIINI